MKAVIIAAVFNGAVLLERILFEPGMLDGQRVVDDQLRGYHRVDLGWITALFGDGIAQAGEIDQRGLAENVVAHHAGRKPGEVQIAAALDKLLQRFGEHRRITAAHQVLRMNARGIGQLVVSTRLNGIDGFTGVEVIQLGARQRLAVLAIHINGSLSARRCAAPRQRTRRSGE